MNLIDAGNSFLLIIDIQEKLIKNIENRDDVVNSTVAAIHIFENSLCSVGGLRSQL